MGPRLRELARPAARGSTGGRESRNLLADPCTWTSLGLPISLSNDASPMLMWSVTCRFERPDHPSSAVVCLQCMQQFLTHTHPGRLFRTSMNYRNLGLRRFFVELIGLTWEVLGCHFLCNFTTMRRPKMTQVAGHVLTCPD